MKTYLVCLLLLSVFAADFETFQEALNFDTSSLTECGNDDFFTSQYEAFFPWIQLIEEGEIEMQEDHSVLTQARDKIKEVREYIMSLDEENEKERGSSGQQQQEVEQQPVQQEPDQNASTGSVQQEAESESESESEDEDPFGWGAGEIPQMLLHKKKTNKGHAKVLLEVMNGSKSLKFKSKIRKIIAMATSLDTDMGTQDVVERKNRKIELCDLILDELVNMIDFLEQVQNDIDFQIEALDIFRKKQEEIVEIANGCGARVVSLQDTYSVSFVETQPLKKNKKQEKKNKKRRN